MGAAIDDGMLHALAAVGEPREVGRCLQERWGDVADRITLYAPYESDPSIWPLVLDAIRSAR
jgi:hypothetical protein